MASTSFSERPGTLKLLGIGFICLMLFFVWLTYAFFDKKFVKADMVTLQTSTAGANLPKNADVKLRGMIVGSVRSVEPRRGGVEMKLALKPEDIDRIPADVSAEIVPKTLFGEKYINLIVPPGSGSKSESLRAGDTIRKADVPIEVEQLLNNGEVLLTAVQPSDLSYTLTALSQALDGQGESLGDSLVTLNDYLTEVNPDVPVLVDDVVKTGEVAQIYADRMPVIAEFLGNSVITGRTLVEKRAELTSFFVEGTRLSDSLTDFTKTNGKNLEVTAKQGREILGATSEYAPAFKCVVTSLAGILPRLDSVLKNRTVHINLRTLGTQPTPYNAGERATLPARKTIRSNRVTRAKNGELAQTCARLAKYKNRRGRDGVPSDAANPYQAKTEKDGAGKPYPGPDPAVFKIAGLNNSHNGKFGDDSDYDRAVAAQFADPILWSSSLEIFDTEEQQIQMRQLAAQLAGVPERDVPEAASALLSPLLRGAEVDGQ